jgi:hypothetical protein
MQIQFKQAEIVAALKQYIIAQGININGKTVEIAFSATRGAAGIVADVNIEEVSIPGFTDAEVEEAVKASEPAAPALSVVKSAPVAAVAKAAIATEAVAEPKAEAQAEEDEQLVDAAAPKTTSLFN